MKIKSWSSFPMLLCVVALAGCRALGIKPPIRITDTPRFYHPLSDVYRSPKPADANIPVLVYPPKRKYQVIGHFTMRSKRYAYDFMNEAAAYNARLAGGDAVIIRDRWTGSYNYVYYPNATTTTTTVTDPQSKADRQAGNPPTTHDETTTDLGDPATGKGDKFFYDADVIVYK